MERAKEGLQSWQYEILKSDEGELSLQIKGSMDASTAANMIKELLPLLKGRASASLTVDLSDVTYLDDFGVLVLVELRKTATRQGARFLLAHVDDRAREMLSLTDFDSFDEEKTSFSGKRRAGMFVRLGDATLGHLEDLKYLVSFVGSVCLALFHVCLHPRSLRREDTYLYMQKAGVDALPIVGLISFLLGLIMAFMSAVQLQQFGANIYVASLVSLSMVRELGPIMTAIIVAGRSGS
ncbi:MAG: STAS domain-containing protein, partial [Deltaproteobacteria bacterium]|nr:STAS domain-containing protein [Deltaproteobacteria bacterium]